MSKYVQKIKELIVLCYQLDCKKNRTKEEEKKFDECQRLLATYELTTIYNDYVLQQKQKGRK